MPRLMRCSSSEFRSGIARRHRAVAAARGTDRFNTRGVRDGVEGVPTGRRLPTRSGTTAARFVDETPGAGGAAPWPTTTAWGTRALAFATATFRNRRFASGWFTIEAGDGRAARRPFPTAATPSVTGFRSAARFAGWTAPVFALLDTVAAPPDPPTATTPTAATTATMPPANAARRRRRFPPLRGRNAASLGSPPTSGTATLLRSRRVGVGATSSPAELDVCSIPVTTGTSRATGS